MQGRNHKTSDQVCTHCGNMKKTVLLPKRRQQETRYSEVEYIDVCLQSLHLEG